MNRVPLFSPVADDVDRNDGEVDRNDGEPVSTSFSWFNNSLLRGHAERKAALMDGETRSRAVKSSKRPK
jgi:hypothetical protein